MFCALLGQDIRRGFTGPMVLWFHFTIHWCAKLRKKGTRVIVKLYRYIAVMQHIGQ